MAQKPEEVLAQQFQFRPRPITDPIGMEFLIREIEDAELRDKITAVRLETAAQMLKTISEGTAKAAEVINAHISGK